MQARRLPQTLAFIAALPIGLGGAYIALLMGAAAGEGWLGPLLVLILVLIVFCGFSGALANWHISAAKIFAVTASLTLSLVPLVVILYLNLSWPSLEIIIILLTVAAIFLLANLAFVYVVAYQKHKA